MNLQTDRLTIRQLNIQDAPEMQQLMSDAKVMEHSFSKPMTADESDRYLLAAIDSYQNYGYGLFALTLEPQGTFIGYCGFTHYEDFDGKTEVEFGYRLHSQYWCRGLASEAAVKLLDYGRHQLGFQRLISIIRQDNQASINVALKAGANFEKQLLLRGHPALVYVYTL